MTNLIITGEVAERLAELAKREQRPVEVILEDLLDNYEPLTDKRESLKDFPVDDLGPWPAKLTLRREDMYGDNER